MKNILHLIVILLFSNYSFAFEKKITLNVSSNGNSEIIALTDYESNTTGHLFWTKNGIDNHYDILKIEKSNSCLNFWLKFNHFNVRASLLIDDKTITINTAGTNHVFNTQKIETQKLIDFIKAMQVPQTKKCFNQTNIKNPIIESNTSRTASNTNNLSTGCGYQLTPAQRIELIKEGFLLEDSNHQGFNTFSKLNYVFPDKIYAKHFNGEIWRIVYLGQPSIIKHYVGKKYTCGGAMGYAVRGTKRYLKHVKLGSIEILENYIP